MARKKFKEDKFVLKDRLKTCVGLVKQGFGIELEWGEVVALKNYIQGYHSEKKRNPSLLGNWEALYFFMEDYFGLNIYAASNDEFLLYNGYTKRWRGERIGLGFFSLGYYCSKPEFKEYCQRRVQMWRDERKLI